MFLMRVGNHKQLQDLANKLVYRYRHKDPFILRSAILEVLQNTIQHSDGRFGLLMTRTSIIITSLPRNSDHRGYSLGLRMYRGIRTTRKGELFIAQILVKDVHLASLDVENVINSPSFDY